MVSAFQVAHSNESRDRPVQADIPPDRPRAKVLKFITTLSIGGTERHVTNLGQALDPSMFDVRFACLRRWGHFLTVLEARAIPVAEYKVTSLYNFSILREQFRLVGHIRRDRIHILHTYGVYPNVFAIPAARLAGVPVIVASIRDMGDLGTRLHRHAQKLACRLADCVLVNAEAIRQRLTTQGYDPAKIAVIRNGVDFSKFERRDASAPLRHELGLPAHVPVVAVLSRLSPLKGLEYFLEAAAEVAGRFKDVHFLVVGDGYAMRDGLVVKDHSYMKELIGYAARLGLAHRVIFTGFRLDMPELLSEVTVSVLPSLSEGLSNVLLESMAAGVPVVATRVGGNPEVVEDGVTGFLIPPRDVSALTGAICRLLENPRLASQFGRAGKQRVVEQFSLDHMVRETERLYTGLLERRNEEKMRRDAAGAGGQASIPAGLSRNRP